MEQSILAIVSPLYFTDYSSCSITILFLVRTLRVNMLFFVASLAVLIWGSTAQNHIQGQDENWAMLNEHTVCLETRNNRYGSFNNYIREGMVTAIKLEYVSGEVRCTGGVEYNSRWGCKGYLPFEQHPLDIVVTDRYNHVLFPKKEYVGFEPGLWYWVPWASTTSSNELVFSDYAHPFFFPLNEEMRVWYGEDLKNWGEGDNAGRVCVNVYAKFMP